MKGSGLGAAVNTIAQKAGRERAAEVLLRGDERTSDPEKPPPSLKDH